MKPMSIDVKPEGSKNNEGITPEEFDKVVQIVNLGEDSFVMVKLQEQVPEDTAIRSVAIDIVPLGGGLRPICDQFTVVCNGKG
jgi:hypothetical protein